MSTENLNKVAPISILFWCMKIIATTLGETLGDFISMTSNLGYAVSLAITAFLFVAFLILQLNQKRYIPIIYWALIVSTTTLGTEISDFIDRSLHIGYTGGSILLLACLLLSLYIWYRKFNNLSVYPIVDRNKETLYWMAILFSNSLGTAFGDYLSDVAQLSYLQGALVCAAVILLVVCLHFGTKINAIFLFWLAFIFTRPFGATFGDFLTKPLEKGGMDLGTLNASAVSIVIMLLLIGLEHRRIKKAEMTKI